MPVLLGVSEHTFVLFCKNTSLQLHVVNHTNNTEAHPLLPLRCCVNDHQVAKGSKVMPDQGQGQVKVMSRGDRSVIKIKFMSSASEISKKSIHYEGI